MIRCRRDWVEHSPHRRRCLHVRRGPGGAGSHVLYIILGGEAAESIGLVRVVGQTCSMPCRTDCLRGSHIGEATRPICHCLQDLCALRVSSRMRQTLVRARLPIVRLGTSRAL